MLSRDFSIGKVFYHFTKFCSYDIYAYYFIFLKKSHDYDDNHLHCAPLNRHYYNFDIWLGGRGEVQPVFCIIRFPIERGIRFLLVDWCLLDLNIPCYGTVQYQKRSFPKQEHSPILHLFRNDNNNNFMIKARAPSPFNQRPKTGWGFKSKSHSISTCANLNGTLESYICSPRHNQL